MTLAEWFISHIWLHLFAVATLCLAVAAFFDFLRDDLAKLRRKGRP